uniref:Uncharacterized protein n=1 Tax=Branchiostoma floridae TaxID=7739 RepID=C3ZCD6_BRAFL|eukprot:XP_002593755.1 hypothetical protein BRAFLDRAFT_107717 [Branchiostoma floridae]
MASHRPRPVPEDSVRDAPTPAPHLSGETTVREEGSSKEKQSQVSTAYVQLTPSSPEQDEHCNTLEKNQQKKGKQSQITDFTAPKPRRNKKRTQTTHRPTESTVATRSATKKNPPSSTAASSKSTDDRALRQRIDDLIETSRNATDDLSGENSGDGT